MNKRGSRFAAKLTKLGFVLLTEEELKDLQAQFAQAVRAAGIGPTPIPKGRGSPCFSRSDIEGTKTTMAFDERGGVWACKGKYIDLSGPPFRFGHAGTLIVKNEDLAPTPGPTAH